MITVQLTGVEFANRLESSTEDYERMCILVVDDDQPAVGYLVGVQFEDGNAWAISLEHLNGNETWYQVGLVSEATIVLLNRSVWETDGPSYDA